MLLVRFNPRTAVMTKWCGQPNMVPENLTIKCLEKVHYCALHPGVQGSFCFCTNFVRLLIPVEVRQGVLGRAALFGAVTTVRK